MTNDASRTLADDGSEWAIFTSPRHTYKIGGHSGFVAAFVDDDKMNPLFPHDDTMGGLRAVTSAVIDRVRADWLEEFPDDIETVDDVNSW